MMKSVRFMAIFSFCFLSGSMVVGMEEASYSIMPYAWHEDQYWLLIAGHYGSGDRFLNYFNCSAGDHVLDVREVKVAQSKGAINSFVSKMRGAYSEEEVRAAINNAAKDKEKRYSSSSRRNDFTLAYYVELPEKRSVGDESYVKEVFVPLEPVFLKWMSASEAYRLLINKEYFQVGNRDYHFFLEQGINTSFLKKLAEAKEPLQLNDTGKNSSAEPKKQKEFKFKMWHGVAIGAGVVGIVGLAAALTAYMVKKETKAEIERARNERAIYYEGTLK